MNGHEESKDPAGIKQTYGPVRALVLLLAAAALAQQEQARDKRGLLAAGVVAPGLVAPGLVAPGLVAPGGVIAAPGLVAPGVIAGPHNAIAFFAIEFSLFL
ncbi:uncharacterized protein GBIM_12373 [Gryllus bimaculatus]|nr:uncharacterized protein GBIM_12373 [Gryllus bimaculatus]